MARTDDVSTCSDPRWLVLAALVVLFLRVCALSLPASQASAQGVAWKSFSSFDPVTVPGGKLILYEFRADWSDPCKRLEATVFTNRQIGKLVETGFVPVQVTDHQRESGQNDPPVAALHKKYHVFAFPTLVAATRDGEAVATLVGSASSLSTLHFLSRALRAQPAHD